MTSDNYGTHSFVQDLKNGYRGVYKQLKMNNVYKIMSLETKSPVQSSSPYRYLQALGL